MNNIEDIKRTMPLLLYMLYAIEVILIVFFGVTAMYVAFTLIFPLDGIETPKKELLSLMYLPFIFLGISGGFFWLSFITAKKIKEVKSRKNVSAANFVDLSKAWQVLSISVVFALIMLYIVSNYWK